MAARRRICQYSGRAVLVWLAQAAQGLDECSNGVELELDFDDHQFDSSDGVGFRSTEWTHPPSTVQCIEYTGQPGRMLIEVLCSTKNTGEGVAGEVRTVVGRVIASTRDESLVGGLVRMDLETVLVALGGGYLKDPAC